MRKGRLGCVRLESGRISVQDVAVTVSLLLLEMEILAPGEVSRGVDGDVVVGRDSPDEERKTNLPTLARFLTVICKSNVLGLRHGIVEIMNLS